MGTIEFSGIVSAGLHRRAYRLMNPLPPWASVLAAIAFLGIPVLIADGDVSLRSGFPVILFALFWVWGAHAFGRPGGAGRAETVMRVEQAALPLIFAREFFNSADDFTRFGDWAVAGVPRQEGGTSAQGPSGG